MEELSPQRLLRRQLEIEARQAVTVPDRADLIEEDKSRRRLAKAETNFQLMASLEEAIQLENLENKNYVSHEQVNLQRHVEESALVKGEQERVWQHTNAKALNRSRFLLSDVAREQVEREALKAHQIHLRIST